MKKSLHEMDFDIIEESLESSGLEEFDGVSRSFTVSEEILGIAQVYCQKLNDCSQIRFKTGLIHYQLNYLLAKVLDRQPRFHLFQRTLGDDTYQTCSTSISTLRLMTDLSLEKRQAQIERQIKLLNENPVSQIRQDFLSLDQLIEFVKRSDSPNYFVLCTGLVLLDDQERALTIAEKVEKRDGVSFGAPHFWSIFRESLCAWIDEGAPRPSPAQAKDEVFSAARMRKTEVEKMSLTRRPTF